MSRRLPLLLTMFATTAIVACSDSAPTPTATRPTVPSAPNATLSPALIQIDREIDALFPPKLGILAEAQWGAVVGLLRLRQRQAAELVFFGLVDWMNAQEDKLKAPPGSTVDQALAQLISDMYVYVFPDRPQPPRSFKPDVAVGIVMPNRATRIVTPSKHAGVAFEAGSVAQPTLIVIHQNPVAFPEQCSGPLATKLCQYPQFYQFDEFPHQRLLKPARFAVCPVTTGDVRPTPEGIDDRLRLAHDAPDVASTSGTIIEGIEILKLVDVHDFMDCEGSSYQIAMNDHHNPFVRGGLFVANRMLAAVKWVVTPKNAYAIDRGGGGEALDFSNFNPVDPFPRVASWIDFEKLNGEPPSCDGPCRVSQDYANDGATFDFQPFEGESFGFVSLVQNAVNSRGDETNHQIQRPTNSEGGGTIVMQFSSARTVSFTIRVDASAPPVTITALGPEGAQIPDAQITHSMASTFGCGECTRYREETITVTNNAGVTRIGVTSGSVVFVDDISIARLSSGSP